jgi:hypothetical protein
MQQNRIELLLVLISITLTLFFSAVFGFAGSSICGKFWGWFWVTFLIQVIGFAAWNSYLSQKEFAANQKAEIEALEQFSKFSVQLSCAYCKQPNTTPIQLNQKNTFKCQTCNQTNGVFMQFAATTMTTPIESVKIPLVDSNSIAEFKVSR